MISQKIVSLSCIFAKDSIVLFWVRFNSEDRVKDKQLIQLKEVMILNLRSRWSWITTKWKDRDQNLTWNDLYEIFYTFFEITDSHKFHFFLSTYNK